MFAWEDYLGLARELATPTSEPTTNEVDLTDARLRSAISRAYYAAFHVARRYVERTRPETPIPRHGGKHEVVWNALKGGKRQERTAYVNGDRLRQKRAKADYELGGLKLPNDARSAIEWAQSVIASLESIPTG